MQPLFLALATFRSWFENSITNISFQKYFILLSASFSIILFLSTYSILPSLNVFGHDEVHYYRDFSFKLIEDGRWLNHILHDLLRDVSLNVWAIVLPVLTWFLFFSLGMSITQNHGYSVIIASTISLSYPLIEQSLWPATSIPAVIVLLFISYLIKQGISHLKIYLLSGMLLFGTMQNFYFLLPLFFLNYFLDKNRTISNQWQTALKHMVYWVAGACAGVLIMFSLVYLYTGHFGVKPAPWRRIMPVHDLADLVRNIIYIKDVFWVQLEHLFRISVGNSLYIVILLLTLIPFQLKNIVKSSHILLILLAVAFSFFLFSVPLAPLILSRSLIALTAAAILLWIVFGKTVGVLHYLTIIVLLAVSLNYSKFGADYFRKHQEHSEFFRAKIKNIIPGFPTSYSTLALFGSIEHPSPEADIFNSPPLMRAIIYSLGVSDILDCRERLDNRCDILAPSTVLANESFPGGNLTFSVSGDKVGIISYIAEQK